MHRKVAAAIVAVLVLAVAGCGGTETTTLSKAALVRRVELACRAGQSKAEQFLRADGRSENPFAGLQAGQRIVIEKIEKLEGSGSAKADFDTFKEALRARLDAVNKVVAAPRADKVRVLRSVQREAIAAGTRIETSARRLGIRGCA
ncbi:MAG: hypothetical protein ACTHOE_12025 [Conexibacter sp.]